MLRFVRSTAVFAPCGGSTAGREAVVVSIYVGLEAGCEFCDEGWVLSRSDDGWSCIACGVFYAGAEEYRVIDFRCVPELG